VAVAELTILDDAGSALPSNNTMISAMSSTAASKPITVVARFLRGGLASGWCVIGSCDIGSCRSSMGSMHLLQNGPYVHRPIASLALYNTGPARSG
jgi:hypothetical protein